MIGKCLHSCIAHMYTHVRTLFFYKRSQHDTLKVQANGRSLVQAGGRAVVCGLVLVVVVAVVG